MKVLILNSGTGSRMGKLTENCPKCLLEINCGETVLSRQLKAVERSGIKDVIITTGKYTDAIKEQCGLFSALNIILVENPLYDLTNYIYSIYLARQYLDDDIVLIHGDLVFDRQLFDYVLEKKTTSLCLVNKDIELPEKDFKGRIKNDTVKEISVDIFDDDCYALFPFYKLSRQCMRLWLEEITAFVEREETKVYAENALNNIAENLNIKAVNLNGHYISEIDTPNDYNRVRNEIFMIDNNTYSDISVLNKLLKKHNVKRPFAIMGRHLQKTDVEDFIDKLNIGKYFGVKENPDEESVLDAQKAFENYNADLLISIGGGSAIDTAKAVKYNLTLKDSEKTQLVHIAIPTTAGSGSESTRFSVIIRNGKKNSLAENFLLPEYAILDCTLLYSMSKMQRNISLMDALCHSIESLLSRNATDESRIFARRSISMILENYNAYADNDMAVFDEVFAASNYAGRAINITKTIFGHALSYTLTTDYDIRHGQAVAMCLICGLEYAENTGIFENALEIVKESLLCEKNETASQKLFAVYCDMGFEKMPHLSAADAKELAKRVDSDRLNNSVINLDYDDLCKIYADVIAKFAL